MAYASVTSLREYLPQIPTYGQQTITVTGGPTGGTFTLTYEGAATGNIAYNATAGAVETALKALAGIGTSGVKVSGPAGGPWVADFSGGSGRSPLALGTNGLTGGSSPSVTVVNTTEAMLGRILDRATDLVRQALRAALADSSFDYAAYGAPATRIVRAHAGDYLTIPPHSAGSVTLVEYQSGTNPATYTTIADQWLEEDGRLYRAAGWGGGIYGYTPRYRITAQWGYGPDVPAAIEELTLELSVNLWRSRDKGGFTEIVGAESGGGIRFVAGLNKQQQLIIESVAAQLEQVHV